MLTDPSFFRSLAALHRAGIPWPQAVATASGGGTHLGVVEDALQRGTALADALAPVVDPLDRAMLAAGEASGRLESTLERIGARHEEEGRLSAGRKSALLYPIVMGHIAALLAAVPDIVTGSVGRGLLWSVGILVPLWIVLWLSRPRRLASSAAHPGTEPPRARGLLRSAIEEADARALLALADGYESGLRLDDTLKLASESGQGGRVAFDLYRARPRVTEGAALATAWSAVPDDMRQALIVGEETGELGDVARRQATQLAFDVGIRRKKVAALLPLGLMLLVGAVVAFRVISFYASMYANLPKP